MQAPALRADKDAARRAMRATLRSLPQEALQHESAALQAETGDTPRRC